MVCWYCIYSKIYIANNNKNVLDLVKWFKFIMLNWLFYLEICIGIPMPSWLQRQAEYPIAALLHAFFSRRASQNSREYLEQVNIIKYSLWQWRCFILRLSIVRYLITMNKPNVSYLVTHSQGTGTILFIPCDGTQVYLAPSWQVCSFWQPASSLLREGHHIC